MGSDASRLIHLETSILDTLLTTSVYLKDLLSDDELIEREKGSGGCLQMQME